MLYDRLREKKIYISTHGKYFYLYYFYVEKKFRFLWEKKSQILLFFFSYIFFRWEKTCKNVVGNLKTEIKVIKKIAFFIKQQSKLADIFAVTAVEKKTPKKQMSSAQLSFSSV